MSWAGYIFQEALNELVLLLLANMGMISLTQSLEMFVAILKNYYLKRYKPNLYC